MDVFKGLGNRDFCRPAIRLISSSLGTNFINKIITREYYLYKKYEILKYFITTKGRLFHTFSQITSTGFAAVLILSPQLYYYLILALHQLKRDRHVRTTIIQNILTENPIPCYWLKINP